MKQIDKMAVTVNTTNRCNLRCSYCMASSGDEQGDAMQIDMDFAKRGIKDAIEGYPTGIKARILRFFAPGEPTQNMQCIKECVNYAKTLSPNIKTELQTNGLFENEDHCEWIAGNLDRVWFSIDAPKEINGTYRLDEYNRNRNDEIIKNLKTVQKNTDVGVRATIVAETIDKQVELVKYFGKLGIKKLCVNPIIESVTRDQRSGTGDISRVSIMKFAKGFVKAYIYAEEIGVHCSNSLSFNFDEKTDIACRSCIPMPQLNPDGSVSSCDMAMYNDAPQELQCFLYGQWEPSSGRIIYDSEKIHNLQNRKLCNLPKCQECIAKDNCAGGCAGRIAYEKGDMYDTIPVYCAATKYIFERVAVNQNIMQYTHP